MASDALTYLSAIAPTFASRADVGVFIEIASSEVSVGFFGEQYPMAVAYLTAHKMELFTNPTRAGSTGSISSKKEGALSVGFSSVGSGSSNSLFQTSYGIEYNRLRNTRSLVGMAVTGGNDVGY